MSIAIGLLYVVVILLAGLALGRAADPAVRLGGMAAAALVALNVLVVAMFGIRALVTVWALVVLVIGVAGVLAALRRFGQEQQHRIAGH